MHPFKRILLLFIQEEITLQTQLLFITLDSAFGLDKNVGEECLLTVALFLS